MKKKIIISILIIGLIVVAGALSVSASNPTDILKSDNVNGIEVKDGKLYSTNKAHTEIGTVKMINSVDEGEKEIYGYDPEAIEKYVSDDPLVKEYIVEDGTDSSHSGIYWMFGKDGKIFLAFNPTDAMKEPNMLKRMTEFCKCQKWS